MSGTKETPRQKMIGMMYLVLTAMLALNVSSSVLQSFLTVNDSIISTNKNFKTKVESSYDLFEKAYETNPEKVQENFDKAKKVGVLSKNFLNYVRTLQIELISKAEGCDEATAKDMAENPHKITRQDDFDTPTRLFIGDGINRSKGVELREAIEKYQSDVLSLLPEEHRESMAKKVDMGTKGINGDGKFIDEHGASTDWENVNFNHSVLVAACAILNKIENDAMNVEYEAITDLYNGVSAGDFKFDKVDPKVVAKSNLIIVGDSYEADIFVAAYDSKAEFSATIGGVNYKSVDGVVKLRFPATTAGLKKLAGTIRVPGADGIEESSFNAEYIVMPPSATISAEAMNVLYIGVDNPVSIAVAGVDANSVEAVISQGSLTFAPDGSYLARVISTGKATITVSAKNGGKKFLAKEFRVKKMPDPIPLVNGIDEYASIVDRNELASSQGLRAFMKDFDFQFNVSVVSFKMSTVISGELKDFSSGNNKFTDDMQNAIRASKKGQVFTFEEIKAKMPTGVITLRNFSLKIK